jgi:phosphohistidine swiveling domain-containing protein
LGQGAVCHIRGLDGSLSPDRRTDYGPVILAKKHGIPRVAGCVEGTQKIHTGQKAKIDGDQGVIHILK